MATQISLERYLNEVFDLLSETFEKSRGIYLDRDTSLFETLDTISAEEASRPISPACASLAAQVEHVGFYLDVLEGYFIGQPPQNVDWGEIWRTVSAVTPEEWAASKARLRAKYHHLQATIRGLENWDGEDAVGAPLAILAHTAYHLGEIRQALCTLKPERG